MKFGLGIDAGGTYTDSVIYDFEANKVVSYAKSITDKEDLKRGINNGLDKLPQDMLSKVELVSLSTTLATNACVEGKGSRAVLILIGCDRRTVVKYGCQYGLPDVNEMIFIEGGHTYDGDIEREPDWRILKEEVIKRKKVTDAFAIVELSGMMNPEFEVKAKTIVSELTDLPVVYANEVSKELNFMKRAASALINAQLIPLINEFLDAVKVNLIKRSIKASMVIVRGDGTLMSEEFARKMPVETLLSGPAASVIGACNLSSRKKCVVVDMGGTTSDIALIENSMVKFANRGIKIGKWQTGTRSISVKSIGLGGDSLITFDKYDNIVVSPFRVAPLCWLSTRWPRVIEDMNCIYIEKKMHTNSLCEYYYLVKDVDIDSSQYYEEKEISIINALKEGPLSIVKLAEKAETTIYELRIKRLEQNGIIMRSGLTPTDIMHLNGDFTEWNSEGAELGAVIMSNRLGIAVDELILRVNEIVKQRIYLNIVNLLLASEGDRLYEEKTLDNYTDLILSGYGRKKGGYISVNFSTDYALIGIGAPIHVYLSDVSDSLNVECIIPEHACVANAVGAITGNITAVEEVVIKPCYDKLEVVGYNCHTTTEKRLFSSYGEALDWAKEEARLLVYKNASSRGAGNIKVAVDIKESSIQTPEQNEEQKQSSILLETIVTATAVGTLK